MELLTFDQTVSDMNMTASELALVDILLTEMVMINEEIRTA